MTDYPTNERFLDLVNEAMDLGIASAKEGGITPFVLIKSGEKEKLIRYVADTFEESVAKAKIALSTAHRTQEFRVLVYDGYITVDGERSDAVLIEGQEIANDYAVCWAARYKPRGFMRSFSLIGDVLFVGRIQSFDHTGSVPPSSPA